MQPRKLFSKVINHALCKVTVTLLAHSGIFSHLLPSLRQVAVLSLAEMMNTCHVGDSKTHAVATYYSGSGFVLIMQMCDAKLTCTSLSRKNNQMHKDSAEKKANADTTYSIISYHVFCAVQ